LLHPATNKRCLDIADAMAAPLPLAAIVRLCRARGQDVGFALDRLGKTAALATLIGQSHAPRTVQALGIQPDRFQSLREIAETVPMFDLKYADGLDRLDKTITALIDRAQSLNL
jgi:hypothetical protein